MRKTAYFIGGFALAASVGVIASSITLDTSDIEAGKPISAANTKQKFDDIQTAINDNDTRITALEAGQSGCPDDMAQVGPICVDKYEASVWSSSDGTGTQYGVDADDYATAGESATGAGDGCQDNGNNCGAIYAVSKAGVTPSTYITWFQAQQACANVGKRLLTNAEWQMAAAGTPDPGANTDPTTGCNTSSEAKAATDASNGQCQSFWKVSDMVGNVNEWVADWFQGNTAYSMSGSRTKIEYGEDDIFAIPQNHSGDESNNNFPAAIYRGGDNAAGTKAGIFTFYATHGPDSFFSNVGFRCAK